MNVFKRGHNMLKASSLGGNNQLSLALLSVRSQRCELLVFRQILDEMAWLQRTQLRIGGNWTLIVSLENKISYLQGYVCSQARASLSELLLVSSKASGTADLCHDQKWQAECQLAFAGNPER